MTKRDRLKRARDARKALGLYLLFQKPHVRQGHADADEIAWLCLLDAQRELAGLIAVEKAQRLVRQAARTDRELRGSPG
jgi:hypothetical protein